MSGAGERRAPGLLPAHARWGLTPSPCPPPQTPESVGLAGGAAQNRCRSSTGVGRGAARGSWAHVLVSWPNTQRPRGRTWAGLDPERSSLRSDGVAPGRAPGPAGKGVRGESLTRAPPRRMEAAELDEQQEKLVLSAECQLVTVVAVVPGLLEVTTQHIYFYDGSAERAETEEGASGGLRGGRAAGVAVRWGQAERPLHALRPAGIGHDLRRPLAQLREVYLRRFNLRRSALELFFVDQANYFLNFPSRPGGPRPQPGSAPPHTQLRNQVYKWLLRLRPPTHGYLSSRSPQEMLRASGLTQVGAGRRGAGSPACGRRHAGPLRWLTSCPPPLLPPEMGPAGNIQLRVPDAAQHHCRADVQRLVPVPRGERPLPTPPPLCLPARLTQRRRRWGPP